MISQWLEPCALTAQGVDSISDQGTKILQARQHSRKKKREMNSQRTDQCLLEVGFGGEQINEGNQKVQTSSYQMTKSLGSDEQDGDNS